MGTYYPHCAGTAKDLIQYLSRTRDAATEGHRLVTLKRSLRGNCRNGNFRLWRVVSCQYEKDAGSGVYVEKDRFIQLDLCHYCKHYGGWGYKPLEEAACPFYFDCPWGYLFEAPSCNRGWRTSVLRHHLRRRRRVPLQPVSARVTPLIYLTRLVEYCGYDVYLGGLLVREGSSRARRGLSYTATRIAVSPQRVPSELLRDFWEIGTADSAEQPLTHASDADVARLLIGAGVYCVISRDQFSSRQQALDCLSRDAPRGSGPWDIPDCDFDSTSTWSLDAMSGETCRAEIVVG